MFLQQDLSNLPVLASFFYVYMSYLLLMLNVQFYLVLLERTTTFASSGSLANGLP
uniref:Uncharacterized protein n=1 Tax=Arion vulgaris TaxID=1028688 RepID=A0A0B7AQG4_9EUPU